MPDASRPPPDAPDESAAELVVVGVHSAKFPAEKVPANLRAAVQRLGLRHAVVNDGDFAV